MENFTKIEIANIEAKEKMESVKILAKACFELGASLHKLSSAIDGILINATIKDCKFHSEGNVDTFISLNKTVNSQITDNIFGKLPNE